jgi:hypothetical protein
MASSTALGSGCVYRRLNEMMHLSFLRGAHLNGGTLIVASEI